MLDKIYSVYFGYKVNEWVIYLYYLKYHTDVYRRKDTGFGKLSIEN